MLGRGAVLRGAHRFPTPATEGTPPDSTPAGGVPGATVWCHYWRRGFAGDLGTSRGGEGSGVGPATPLIVSPKGSPTRPFREPSRSSGLAKLIASATGPRHPCWTPSSTQLHVNLNAGPSANTGCHGLRVGTPVTIKLFPSGALTAWAPVPL